MHDINNQPQRSSVSQQFVVILTIVGLSSIVLLILGLFFYFKNNQAQIIDFENNSKDLDNPVATLPTITPTTKEKFEIPSGIPTLSRDKKSILLDSNIILSISDGGIFNYFLEDSQLCDTSNLNTSPDRDDFCTNISTFRNKTSFVNIVVSPDKKAVGFNIQTEEMTPDQVVGILQLSNGQNKVSLLTSYYMGNEFLSFSPSGKYFIYQANCWEAMCGLVVKDTESLKEVNSINNPEYIDTRMTDATFSKWISDNEVEYVLKGTTEDTKDETKVEKF